MTENKLMIVILVLSCIVMAVVTLLLRRQETIFDGKIQKSKESIDQDFGKVIRVIESCQNKEQIKAADKLIMSFQNKHSKNEEECKDCMIKLTELFGRKNSTLQ